jgi:hypothetical protein
MNRESTLLWALTLSLVAAGALHCSNVSGGTTGTDAGPCLGGVGAGQSMADEAGGDDAGSGADGDDAGSGAGGDDAGGDDAGSDDAGSNGNNQCRPPDSDGLVGGCYFFSLVVDDTGFSPIILKAQNLARTTIELTNTGTRPHDFVLGCVPLHAPGCPSQVCFPPRASIATLGPGGTATTTFVTPYLDGIYDFRSDLAGDSPIALDGGIRGLRGQFVVQ